MKENNITKINICPCCGKSYRGRSALSRRDNKMSICSDCGTREALESIGISQAEQEQILNTIHRYKCTHNMRSNKAKDRVVQRLAMSPKKSEYVSTEREI